MLEASGSCVLQCGHPNARRQTASLSKLAPMLFCIRIAAAIDRTASCVKTRTCQRLEYRANSKRRNPSTKAVLQPCVYSGIRLLSQLTRHCSYEPRTYQYIRFDAPISFIMASANVTKPGSPARLLSGGTKTLCQCLLTFCFDILRIS